MRSDNYFLTPVSRWEICMQCRVRCLLPASERTCKARGGTYRGLVRGWKWGGDELYGSIPTVRLTVYQRNRSRMGVCVNAPLINIPTPPLSHHPKGASLMVMAKGCRCLGDWVLLVLALGTSQRSEPKWEAYRWALGLEGLAWRRAAAQQQDVPPPSVSPPQEHQLRQTAPVATNGADNGGEELIQSCDVIFMWLYGLQNNLASLCYHT